MLKVHGYISTGLGSNIWLKIFRGSTANASSPSKQHVMRGSQHGEPGASKPKDSEGLSSTTGPHKPDPKLLDVMKDTMPNFRHNLVKAMQRLASESTLHPTCGKLDDVVTTDAPEHSGSFHQTL
ncbi:hypothetical protein H0H92_013028 [Tricholoma furcatifolium]|nr:hypothetical protein H0H92_013028 [Tricholoma furcatifolium]